MAAVNVTVKGGDKLARHLQTLAKKLGTGGVVRVGFLEKSTYPVTKKNATALHVAQVAFWNEYGTVRAGPRPFFRGMIRAQSPTWGKKMAALAKATDFNASQMLGLMGTNIKDELVKAIVDWPADNAPSTVRRKGFNKGLIDKGVMQRSVDFEVVT